VFKQLEQQPKPPSQLGLQVVLAVIMVIRSELLTVLLLHFTLTLIAEKPAGQLVMERRF